MSLPIGQKISNIVGRMFVKRPDLAGEPPLATLARGVIDQNNNPVVLVDETGALVLTKSGQSLIDPNGRISASRPPYPDLSKIGFVGDSITGVGCNTVPALNTLLTAQLGTAPTLVNRGVSGTTTADWVNGTNGADLPGAIAAFVAASVGTVNLMLGTNDSKTAKNITPAAYRANLQTIIAALFAGVPTLQYVVLNHSPYINANAYGEWDLTASNALLVQYGQVIDSLDAPSLGIWVGDRFTYYATKTNPGLQQDGIHPTGTTGSVAQAQLWLNGYNQRVAPWTFPILDAGQATRLNAAGNALEAWTPYVLSSTQPLLFGSGPTAVQIFGGRTAYTVEMRNVDDTGFVALLVYRLTASEGINAAKANLSALPTSASGLSAGDLWRNGNVVNIV